MAQRRGCSLCGKPIKSLNGLGQHARYCKARTSLSELTSEARALLERQWALESSQHLQNNILPSHEVPINTSIEAGPEFSDMNLLDDATYHSNLASAAPDATPEPEEIFEAGNVPINRASYQQCQI
jgi:hypothetical protein